MTLGSGIFSKMRAQLPHLLQQSGGIAAEINDVRKDILSEFAANAAIAVEEFVNPIAAGAALISTAALSTVAPRTVPLLALAANINPPRQISVTTAASGTPADAPATALVTGKDIFGNAMTETLTISQTNATVTGAKCFASVSSIVEAAGDGVGATLSYGIGAPIGLGKPIKSRSSLAFLIKEVANGAVVTNGVIAGAAAALPNGSYAPNTAADGTKTYAIYYEYDATTNRDA
jgi:hypothetical protein